MGIINRSRLAKTVDYPLSQDTFTTPDSAPIGSPRNAEPGPGDMVITDTTNDLSISSDNLVCTGGNNTFGDPGYYRRLGSGTGIGRGCYYELSFTLTSAYDLTTGIYFGFSVSTTLSLANLNHNINIGGSGGWRSWAGATADNSADTVMAATLASGAIYTIRVYALITGGALWLVKGGQFGTSWHTLAYSRTGTTSPLYPALFSYAMTYQIHSEKVVRYREHPNLYLAFYDGMASQSSGYYQIGRAVSLDGRNFGRWLGNPVLTPGSSGTWDSLNIWEPCAMIDGDELDLWYGGYDGTNYGIGYATSTNWGETFTKDAGNPVLSQGATGQWDDAGVMIGTIYKDADAESTARYKMVYWGYKTNWQVGYAYSSNKNGPYTKSSGNPIIAIGSSSEWDSNYAVGCSLVKDSSTYYLYYGGNTAGGQTQCGLVTFSQWSGPFTKSASNPIISRRTGDQALSTSAAIGDTSISVASSTGFTVGEAIAITDSGQNLQQNRVSALPDTTHITLESPLFFAANTTNSAKVESQYKAVLPWHVLNEGGIWKMWVLTQGWGQGGNNNAEAMAYATSTAPDSGWALDHANPQPLLLPLSGAVHSSASPWDGHAAEALMHALDINVRQRVRIPA